MLLETYNTPLPGESIQSYESYEAKIAAFRRVYPIRAIIINDTSNASMSPFIAEIMVFYDFGNEAAIKWMW